MRLNILTISIFLSCIYVVGQDVKSHSLQHSIQFLQKPSKDYVFVIAHRGDWRNAPENSLGALDGCIRLGVDAMETDLAETKDGVLIIMHDETVNRTTNGKGAVKEMTLEQIKKLQLKDGLGRKTNYSVPTLKEMLLHAKGKIILDLDIKSETDFKKVVDLLKETGTMNQVIVRSYRTIAEAKTYYGESLKDLNYIPGIREDIVNISSYIHDFEKEINPKAYTLVFETDTSKVTTYTDTILANKDAVWVHVITGNRSGNHNDERALKDPEGAYGWLIKKGVRMMQTDRPELLISYLKKNGFR